MISGWRENKEALKVWLLKNPKPKKRASGISSLLALKAELSAKLIEIDKTISGACTHAAKDLQCQVTASDGGDFCAITCTLCGQVLDSTFLSVLNAVPGK